MKLTLSPAKLTGTVAAIPSKSQAHRLLILSAFADRPTKLHCPRTSRDIEATALCLNALGAEITGTPEGYLVKPVTSVPEKAVLPCGESGSTLRFLLPIAGALGVDGVFQLEGRLPCRPLSPLWEEMERMGCTLSRPTADTVRCCGRLRSGEYSIDGGVSSQFITGLLFALSLMEEKSTLRITGKTESLPYIQMTCAALSRFASPVGVLPDGYEISPVPFRSPGEIQVEGDWSNAAFWYAANALGSGISVTGMDPDSPQGDRAVLECLKQLEYNCVIDASHIPDLVPILSVVAGAREGAVFINAGRLRLKETDRLATTAALIQNIGGSAEIRGDSLIIRPAPYTGGTVDATGDHRIAMAAAIAATISSGPVTVIGAEAVEKSYPAFWQDYRSLGGIL